MTDFDLLESVYPLAAAELYRQWVLGRDDASMPPEWQRWTIEGWTLAAHPDAHVCRLQDESGEPLGWIVEPLLQTSETGAVRPSETATLAGCDAARLSEQAIEKALYGRDHLGHTDGTGFAGMWIAIIISKQVKRVYLSVTNSVLYDARKEQVATSHNLLQPFERDLALSGAFDPLETRRYFSLGLTAFVGIRRLLPNHYLDLEQFCAVRHWPRAPGREESPAEAVAAMMDHGRHQVANICREGEGLTIPLSAGNDSRAVLALCRPFVDAGRPPVKIFTSVGENFGHRVDLQGARRLATIAGLPLEVRHRERHEAAPVLQVMRNFARISEGMCGPALSNPRMFDTRLPQAGPRQDSLTLAGMAGATGRGFLWRGGVPANLTPDILLRRLNAPILPQTREAAQTWLDDLPDFVRQHPEDVLDLAYVEQREGCWEALSRYLWPGRPRTISFMASCFCTEKMLSLPRPYRRSARVQVDMIAYGWPELLAVPINRAAGWLRVEQIARDVIRQGRRGVRLLRRS